MKPRYVLLIAFIVVSSMLCLCSCEKTVESSEITLDEMSITLPDSGWVYGDDDDQYVNDYCDITLIKTDDSDYYERVSANERREFEFYNYENIEEGIPPDVNFMYIDGYVSEFYSGGYGLQIMIEKDDDYYILFADYIGDKEIAKEEVKDILSSIRFEESGNQPWLGMPWQDAIDEIKTELTEYETFSTVIQGNVVEVSHAADSNGKPYYIDIGEAYPEPSRITGVIWEEYQDEFDELELSNLEGKEVLMCGECYLYDGVVNFRIEDDYQIEQIYEIQDL